MPKHIYFPASTILIAISMLAPAHASMFRLNISADGFSGDFNGVVPISSISGSFFIDEDFRDGKAVTKILDANFAINGKEYRPSELSFWSRPGELTIGGIAFGAEAALMGSDDFCVQIYTQPSAHEYRALFYTVQGINNAFRSKSLSYSLTPVPEPSDIFLACSGLSVILAWRKKHVRSGKTV